MKSREKGVTLTGLIERIGHVSVKALRVLATNILNITNIISEEQALSLLKQPHFDHQLPTLLTDLTPLPMPPPSFNWIQHGSKLSFGLLLLLIVLMTSVILLGYLAWRKREYLINWLVSNSKDKPGPVLMLKDQSSPVLTNPTPPQHPVNVYPSLAAFLNVDLGEQNYTPHPSSDSQTVEIK